MTEKKLTKKEIEARNKQPIDMYDDTSECRRCLKVLGDTMQFNCKPGGYIKPARRNNVRLYIVLDAIPKNDYSLIQLDRGLEKLCDQTDLKMSEVYVDYAVRCTMHKNIWGFSTQNRQSIIHNCRVYINGEISRLKPDVVLLMGEISLQSILKQTQIRQWDNRIIKHRELQAYAVPVALKNNRLELSEDHLDSIKSILNKPVKFKRYKTEFVKTETQFKKLIDKLKDQNIIAVDIETSSLSYYDEYGHILGISISFDGKSGYFVPVKIPYDEIFDADRKSYWDCAKNYWKPALFNQLKKLLERKNNLILMHNAGFDWNFLTYFGFDFKGIVYDTLIGSSVLYDFSNGLKPLAWIHTDFGGYDDELDELLPSKKSGYHVVPATPLASYAAYDGIVTVQEYETQQKLIKDHPAKDLIYELMDLRINLSKMELKGCRVDIKKAENLKAEFENMLDKFKSELRVIFDVEDINFNSSVQLLKLFYKPGCLLETMVNKARKKPSTDKKLLKYMLPPIKKYPVKNKKEQKRRDDTVRSIELLSDYRKYSKYISTYLVPFIENSVDGYYHPYFTVGLTKTGRLSGNMQQLPRQGGLRDCIIADPDCELVELDYSQAEMRVAAEMSGDEKLLSILNNRDADIHSEIGHVSIKKPDGSNYDKKDFKDGDISELIRPQAKIVGFSILYGKTEMGLSEDLNCTIPEARKVIQYLLDGFPGLKVLIESLHNQVEEFGYVDTLFGRRLWIPEGLSHDQYKINEAHRYSVNYPVQSASSDILVHALNRLAKRIIKEKWKAEIILTVHDSILFNVHKSQTNDFVKMAKEEMEKPIPQLKKVLMFADAKVGQFWGSGMKKWG